MGKEIYMDNREGKMPIPNTVGELINFLKQFPENTLLCTYKTVEYERESSVCIMSYDYYERLGTMNITFD